MENQYKEFKEKFLSLVHNSEKILISSHISPDDDSISSVLNIYRIIKTLESLKKTVPDRTIVLARELTKIFEETIYGTAEEVMNDLETYPEKVRGAFVVIVGRKK